MSKPISILVVDDEFSVRDSLQAWFRESGYRVESASSGKEALSRIAREEFDIYLLDIKMAGMDGLELQQRIHEGHPGAAIILMTAYASVETAVQALKQGAFDYITKPFDPDDLEHLIRNASEKKMLERQNEALQKALEEVSPFGEILGDSPSMHDVLKLVSTVASSNATVLVRGESGTGKELVARAIHSASPRRLMPFVTVNCGAMPEGLLESELFGHERGAFTGAQYRHKGKFEMADGGTLFLDEIGDVSLKTQADLLRVLEEKTVTRLGGGRSFPVDFRVVAATNRGLESLVADKSFREDLYYRLNVVQVHLPPLRERPEDIPVLVGHFAKKFAAAMNRPLKGVSAAALQFLATQPWPGNVRELKNAVERAVVLCRGTEIGPGDFQALVSVEDDAVKGLSLSEVERLHIARVLKDAAWNISRAARVLEIDRATLYSKIKRYDLKKGAEGA